MPEYVSCEQMPIKPIKCFNSEVCLAYSSVDKLTMGVQGVKKNRQKEDADDGYDEVTWLQ